ncbi:MAG TPA: hypothetical protein P5552_18085 [Candidatus Competibacteraceae bacterium]|nr:hypothetical protein [Candidatus Competibacteraceae bacterium]
MNSNPKKRGRPATGQTTTLMRVPVALKPAIQEWVSNYRRLSWQNPRPGQPDDDEDAYWVAEAEAVLARIERGEEKVWTFEEWQRHCNALDS